MLSISPVYARYILQEFIRRGEDTAPLFSNTSLTEATLQASDAIGLDDFNQLLSNGRTALEDELGLIIGRQANVMTLGSVGIAAVAAPTLREGLQALESFSRLHASQIAVELRSNLEGANVLMHFINSLGEVERFHAESGALLLQAYAEMVCGEPIHDAEFRMHFSEPAYAQKYRNHFHSPVSFGWATSSVELPLRWLDRPSPYFHHEQWQQSKLTLESRLREYRSQVGGGYIGYVRSHLRASALPLPDLASPAKNLNISTRTLNRRLSDEDGSFRELRNTVLSEWAKRYLSESAISVEAIAAALGYEDASNFRRAFRAWEGVSPGSYRKNHQSIASPKP
ncbi:MAG: AraC family transcriptional regulator ligand-binding domain-containing protein [Halieaceae bacterium]